MRVLAKSKRAYFDYQILEKFQAGICLLGQEVKSIKTYGLNLNGSYVIVKNEEVFWVGTHISPYQPGNIGANYDPKRERKLLLKKSEIKYLIGKAKEKGLTLVPLGLYNINGRIKLEFGIGKRKKKVNKKEIIKRREIEKEIQRALKEHRIRG